ncbi:Prefoldin domain containing protein [Trichuris trichiura]|uniref:Prefoldin domain containing protein n=1 Tax=Trichuris trichiura TaxID=36087 RepID=A0A077ZID5_TRITR|nr:Prefoldin domain containing protein [Trichuris trichiura]
MADLTERVEVLENFLYNRLNSDLKDATESLQSTLSRLDDIRTTSSALRDILLLPSTVNLTSKVDLGNNAFAQAIIPDANTVFVKVLPSIYVEMTLEEAIDLLVKLEACVVKVANRQANYVARINAHVKLVKQGLEKLIAIPPSE